MASHRLSSGVGSLPGHGPQVRVIQVRVTLDQGQPQIKVISCQSQPRSQSPWSHLSAGECAPPTSSLSDPRASSSLGFRCFPQRDEKPPAVWDGKTACGRSPCPWPPGLPDLV